MKFLYLIPLLILSVDCLLVLEGFDINKDNVPGAYAVCKSECVEKVIEIHNITKVVWVGIKVIPNEMIENKYKSFGISMTIEGWDQHKTVVAGTSDVCQGNKDCMYRVMLASKKK